MEQSKINILVVEDHEIARLGLRFTLSGFPQLNLIGEAVNGASAIELSAQLKPDVILMDIGLDDMNGIEASRTIKQNDPDIRIIILTADDNREKVLAAFAAGADAYCIKAVSPAQLMNAIDAVMQGAKWLAPGVAQHILDVCMAKPSPLQMPSPTVSPQNKGSFLSISKRELEVLQLLVEGMTNQQIADKLCLSHETIKTHMRHIMDKLVVSDRTQAALKAIRQGIV